MRTSQNFFFRITELEKKILNSDNADIDMFEEPQDNEENKISLQKLIEFIESCPIHTTKINKFVCSHFRLKEIEIYKLYAQSRTEPISESSFRSSYSAINREFTSLFDSIQDIEIAYLNNDLETIKDINFIIFSVSIDEKLRLNYFDRLGINLNKYMKEVKKKPINQYSLEECELEIEFLKAIDKETIQTTIDTLDQDKIRYLLTLLGKSIIGSSARINTETQKKTYGASKTINTDKLELLKKLNIAQPMSFILSKKFDTETPSELSEIDIKQALNNIEEQAKEVKHEVENTTTYTQYFKDNELVNKLLTVRTNKHINELDDIQADWEKIKEEKSVAYRQIMALMSAFTFFDMDYFEYSINKIPKSYIEIALQNYIKGKKKE